MDKQIKELLDKIKQKMPNGELAVLAEKIDNLQEDIITPEAIEELAKKAVHKL